MKILKFKKMNDALNYCWVEVNFEPCLQFLS